MIDRRGHRDVAGEGVFFFALALTLLCFTRHEWPSPGQHRATFVHVYVCTRPASARYAPCNLLPPRPTQVIRKKATGDESIRSRARCDGAGAQSRGTERYFVRPIYGKRVRDIAPRHAAGADLLISHLRSASSRARLLVLMLVRDSEKKKKSGNSINCHERSTTAPPLYLWLHPRSLATTYPLLTTLVTEIDYSLMNACVEKLISLKFQDM
jgi:hypothetical protein